MGLSGAEELLVEGRKDFLTEVRTSWLKCVCAAAHQRACGHQPLGAFAQCLSCSGHCSGCTRRRLGSRVTESVCLCRSSGSILVWVVRTIPPA
jgi:hypothetical protein